MTAIAITAPAGIIDGLPFDEYLSIAAASVTAMKAVALCPAKLGVEREQTAAMRMGSLTHCAILEPDALERRYAPTDLDRRGTKAWDAEALAAGGRELIKRDEWNTALAMRDAVLGNPTARALLAGAVTELTLVWEDDDTDLPCKARLDAHSPLGGPIDIKTASDASPHGWRRNAEKLMYHIQAAHYLAGCRALGLRADSMPFIVIESSAPFVVEVYPLGLRTLTEGERQRQQLLMRWHRCINTEPHLRPGYTGLPFTEIEFSDYTLSRSFVETEEY